MRAGEAAASSVADGDRMVGVDRVARADAHECGAARLERLADRCRVVGAVTHDRLDPTRFEQVPRERTRVRRWRPSSRPRRGTPSGGRTRPPWHRRADVGARPGRRSGAAAAERRVRSTDRRSAPPGPRRRPERRRRRCWGTRVTPVIGSSRVATAWSRRARVASTRACSRPCPTASSSPPAPPAPASESHAAFANWSVSCSTYHEPPAMSITLARLLSSISTSWVLRHMRRPSSLPPVTSSSSCGRIVTASAPPTPAPKHSTVPRSRLTDTS